ncbi:hypothetical protein IHE45_12G000800 [Dioscorea alata]|uniref:Uncharacterized protein n=2 Tax=Dioscorea alata TaxID=55571 RepID=A0ACB7V024_DIOAL|nr:hypothetical protein IHE45_12G000800 [Dioscorea alata]KAH7666511.1 hypothetical protein IHE45_12G000800 [Dioscorea alata]
MFFDFGSYMKRYLQIFYIVTESPVFIIIFFIWRRHHHFPPPLVHAIEFQIGNSESTSILAMNLRTSIWKEKNFQWKLAQEDISCRPNNWRKLDQMNDSSYLDEVNESGPQEVAWDHYEK